MTISYSLDVAKIDITTIFRILFKWKGSVYKKLYQEFLIYAAMYFLISFIYRYALDNDQKRTFETVSLFMETYSDLVPIAFILGFYVSIVFSRWQQMFNAIPWPDQTILTICTFMNGNDSLSCSYRQAVVRYLLAAMIVVFRDISAAVRKRFPTLQHIVDAGILRAEELEMYESATHCNSHKYYVFIEWSLNIMARCRSEQRIKADPLLKNICENILRYRSGLGAILQHDWVSVPLIYTQIVAMATWFYFLVCLLGRQYLDPAQNHPKHTLDIYVPPFTFLQFWFYMGWLKAAEGMLNPFGTDDDDFELNYIIERNFKEESIVSYKKRLFQVGISQAKELCGVFPPLSGELDMDTPDEAVIPHTEASLGQMDNAPVQSAENIVVPEKLARAVSQTPLEEGAPPPRNRSIRSRLSVLGSTKRRQESRISNLSLKSKNPFFRGLSQLRKSSTNSDTSNNMGMDNGGMNVNGSQNSLTLSDVFGLAADPNSDVESPKTKPEDDKKPRYHLGSESDANPRLTTVQEDNDEATADDEPPKEK